MNFIDQIIQNSQVKEAKLYGPSKKAAERPETGITIQTPAAFHVIKDCATLANQYLPHYVFGTYTNPFTILKGKITKQDISEFVEVASTDIILNQLLILVLDKVKNIFPQFTVVDTINEIKPNENTNDPYGDYESVEIDNIKPVHHDSNTILCMAFGV
jgi:hypothetical protein